MEKNLITFDELTRIYREWLSKNFWADDKESFECEIEKNPHAFEPEYKDGDDVTPENSDTVITRYEEAQMKLKPFCELHFVFYEYSKPIFDEDGDIEDYEVIGYKVGDCD